jgi:hypothetical protein
LALAATVRGVSPVPLPAAALGSVTPLTEDVPRGSGAGVAAGSCLRDEDDGRPQAPSAVLPGATREASAQRSLPLGIPTAGRASTVATTLAAWGRHALAHHRDVKVCVADGSNDATFEELTAQIGARVPGLGHVHVTGIRHREALCARAAEAGYDAEALRFLLTDSLGTGCAYGVNRNALALMMGASTYVSVDDDVLPPLARAPSMGHSPSFGARILADVGDGYRHYQPNEFWFFADRIDAFTAIEEHDSFTIDAHADVLGRAALEVLGTQPKPWRWSSCSNTSFAREIRRGAAPVVASFMGLAGDIGWYSPTWLMLLEGDSRARLMTNEASYLSATRESRSVVRCADTLTISDGRYCQSAVLGLDARVADLPFFPIGRYEDGGFRLLVRRVLGEVAFAHLPFALRHDPPGIRRYEDDIVWKTSGWIRIGDVVAQAIKSVASPQAGEPATAALARVCRRLEELSSLSVGSFANTIEQLVRAQRDAYIDHLLALVDEYRGPPAWVSDVRLHIDAYTATIGDAMYPVPRELQALGRDEGLRCMQRGLALFARGARQWGDLRRDLALLKSAHLLPPAEGVP